MVLDAETKFLIEDYIDSAIKFLEILDYYRTGSKEVKEYMDRLFKEKTGRKFSETFPFQSKARRKGRSS